MSTCFSCSITCKWGTAHQRCAPCCRQVVELGQVGKAGRGGGAPSLFMHSQQGAGFGDAAPLQGTLRAAATAAGHTVCSALQCSLEYKTAPLSVILQIAVFYELAIVGGSTP